MMIRVLADASLESPNPKLHHVFNMLMQTIDDIKNDLDMNREVEQILPKPNPLFESWAASVLDAAREKTIPLQLDPEARSERYRKRREAIELQKTG
jgi:hypothetical protein